jgi:hypothetical protein
LEVLVLEMKCKGNGCIRERISEAIKRAEEKRILVSFEYEGIKVEVGRDSNPDLILKEFYLFKNGYRTGRSKVCAYPHKTSKEEKEILDSLGLSFAY